MTSGFCYRRFERKGRACAWLPAGLYVARLDGQHFARKRQARKAARSMEPPLLPFGSYGYRTDCRVLRCSDGGYVVLQLCLRRSCLTALQAEGIRAFTVRELLDSQLPESTMARLMGTEGELSAAVFPAGAPQDWLVEVNPRRWNPAGIGRVLAPCCASLFLLAALYGRLQVHRQANMVLQERYEKLSSLAADYTRWKHLAGPTQDDKRLELEEGLAVLLSAFADHSARLIGFSLQPGLIQAEGSGGDPLALASQLESAGWLVSLNLNQSDARDAAAFSLSARGGGK